MPLPRPLSRLLPGPGAGRRFVVLFPGRTGSSWLRHALNGHPRVRMEGEMFVGLDAEAQHRRLEGLYRKAARDTAVGFKTKPRDVADPSALVDAIGRHDATVIRLARCDLLRMAVSRLNARRLRDATGRWNADGDVPPVEAIPVDPEALEAALAACREEVARVDELCGRVPGPVHEIEYVEILRRPEEVLRRCQGILGVSERPLVSMVRKNTDEDLMRAVPNLAFLRDRFAGSDWASVFDVPLSREVGSAGSDDEG